jgi:hypothetical protein
MPILSQQKQSQAPDFPNIRPSLDLRFALAKKLDPRITFTRGSTGTYFGPDGLMKTAGVNEPRFDHDPVTGQSLGLMIEEGRTNQLVRGDIEGTVGAQPTGMQLFGPSNGQTAVVSTDVSLGPNGQSCKHTRGTWSDNNIGYFGSGTVTPGSTYVFSVYVYIPSSQAKNFEGKLLFCDMENAFTSRTRASADVTIVDRWQRIWGTCVPSTTSATWVLRTNANAGTFCYTDCWQLELGSFPTSYMPASGGSQFTRNPDFAQMTGTNFSSWYNQTEGTIFMSLVPNYSNAVANRFRRYLTISAGSGQQDNVIQIISVDNANQIQSAVWYGSVFQAGANLTVRSGTQGKIAHGFRQNSATLAGNGTLLQNDISCILPSIMNRMDIGGYINNTGYQSTSTISRITYYPIQLTNQQLINLTS